LFMTTTIGIFKPFKKVFFHETAEETAAWSYEVINLMKMLQSTNATVKILSPTDEPSVEGSRKDYYDRIIVVGGVFANEPADLLFCLRKQTDRLDLLITDLRLIPNNQDDWKLFDIQSH
jgi:hypothetical protein